MNRPLLIVITALVMVGCGPARGPYAQDAGQPRDIVRAEAAYQQAVACVGTDAEDAEKLLREALGHDLYHGPAHNNLGVLLLRRDRLYEAAEEFEWARKLLPDHPEPRLNLAITLERGGRFADALEAARAALEVRPGHLPSIQEIALIQVREGFCDDQTGGRLDTIVARTTDPSWRDWARRQRLTLDGRTASSGGP